MRVLVIDIGGTSVKFSLSGKGGRKRRFDSNPSLPAVQVVKLILSMTGDWEYDRVSVGFPGTIIHGKIVVASGNLGDGWEHFDFKKYFKKPVKIINDAAMQALGSYAGGRMLFLGLGTGLGSALILDEVIIPLELGELNYSNKRTLGEALGKEGLKAKGTMAWEKAVHDAVKHLSEAFNTDYVVLGGGNVECLRKLPAGARRGHNNKAFVGGARLWGVGGMHVQRRKHTFVIA
jgi:polyphosphate glucokinase